MKNYLKLLKKVLLEYETEERKIRQNQERLDRIETRLSTEYENEKKKIRQNQERLDNLERMIPQCQRELNSLFAAVQEVGVSDV